MNDPLSIAAAARDAGDAIALRTSARERYTFAAARGPRAGAAHDLAREWRRPPCRWSAANTLDTLITLYALLEARVPVLLLHPKLTTAERAAEIGATERRRRRCPATRR